ncbi:NmrA family NAD(P)-binding protein [Luteibacter aegosomaticola]|uniref:NmrA family NAD(P)-binding protein n=1 Tax=Luteibacter aegosomaticola TaxID=2911538 RepID=UPI001FFB8254|nr:NmrA family NAD(P)-binding protein [Luteibacter aegosomaticola]UPG89835.1 NmrA family NAD(P)-binding protein [Luteibacter aegosomaticola]
MFAITGITGQVGASLAEALRAAGQPFRAVVRDAAKAERFEHSAIAELDDTPALTRAFEGAEAVFILLPPLFDPSPGFPESERTIMSIRDALLAAQPGRVVVLSTIGADAPHENLLSQLGRMEKVLGALPMPVAFLRAGWFMENSQWDVAQARETGTIDSYLVPLDRRIAMVATKDIGRLAAKLLGESWDGVRVVELEGPVRVSPNDIAAALAKALNRDVVVRPVPRETWEPRFREQGMQNPGPRMRMVDGFNEGWIDFGAGSLKGETGLDEVIASLTTRA